MSQNEIGTLLGKPKEDKKYQPDDRWILPKSLIGVEFEYEGVIDPNTFFYENPTLTAYWSAHREQSLKDHGCEFVFRVPMFGTDAYNALDQLTAAARRYKFKCTTRAGLHVHLDVRDLETSQLIGLIILYTMLEPLLFDWAGDDREHSVYCMPLFKADESLASAVQIIKAIKFDEGHEGAKQMFAKSYKFDRYAALNLNALSKYGSVEFRHLKTTTDLERVVDWINIIQSLKAATFKLPTSDGAILAAACGQRLSTFLTYIFGVRLAGQLWTPEAQNKFFRLGVPTANDLVLNGLSQTEWEDYSTIKVPRGPHAGFEKFVQGLSALQPRPKKAAKIEFKYTIPPHLLNDPHQAANNLPEPEEHDLGELPPGFIDDGDAEGAEPAE